MKKVHGENCPLQGVSASDQRGKGFMECETCGSTEPGQHFFHPHDHGEDRTEKIKGLPDEINAAIKLLWDFADDACLSGRTKDECIAEGYDCKSDDGAHILTFLITFSISRR